MTDEILNVNQLYFAYSSISKTNKNKLDVKDLVINNLSFSLAKGEIVCILGASGCGKSTLLNLVASLLNPRSGSIELKCLHSENVSSIGYIFQEDALFPWRTVKDNLMLAKQLNKTDMTLDAYNTRLNEYFALFHLSSDVLNKYPSQLSGGMRQRISIIQSLMFNPQLFLLDEPFSALDFYTKLALEDEFYQMVKNQNKSAIFVTHDIDEAIAIANRILIMDKSGNFSHQYNIDFGINDKERLPEAVRGLPGFAELYKQIWSDLKGVISL